MVSTRDLERWWDGLSEEGKADAKRSRQKGHMSKAMRKSLKDAGLSKDDPDDLIPDEVGIFLKARH